MSEKAQLSHVAFLVRSVVKAAAVTKEHGFPNGPAERWEGEGTLEIYVGDPEKTGRLLLMEAVQDGAYKRALEKRGPGLHHIAIDVLDLERYILQLSGAGWLLHPQSLKTMKEARTAYLARPGMPMLIEVQGRESLLSNPLFITRLELPISSEGFSMVSVLGIRELTPSDDKQVWLTCEKKRFSGDRIICSGKI